MEYTTKRHEIFLIGSISPEHGYNVEKKLFDVTYVDGPITVHHMNPLTKEDIENLTENCFDPDGLITVSDYTHKRIHYDQKEYQEWVERKPGDTKLW